MTELKRELGTWAAASIVVGTVIGSGIFLVPKSMIQRVGTPEMVFLVLVFGGLLSLAGALSYAELAAAMPEAGGEYAYLREAYGPMWGFLYSWTQMWVAKSGSIATLATGFFYYLTNFFPGLDGVFYTLAAAPWARAADRSQFRYGQLFAMALILSLAWLNYYGVKIGGDVQVVVTIVKVALIAFIIIAGLGFGPAHGAASAPVASMSTAGFFAALVAALWAYDGWNNVSMVASEVRDPQRNLPRALIWGTVAVIAIYLLANAAYFHVLTGAEVAGSTAGRRGNDAPDPGWTRGQRGLDRRHDQHLRGAERLDSVRFARSLCGGPRRPVLLRRGPRPSEIPHAVGFDSGFERLGGAAGILRTV